jgi:hypothetical protein
MSTAWHQKHIRQRVLQRVLAEVFELTNIAPERVLSLSREQHAVAARTEVVKRLDAMGLYSMSEIGRAINRDHSSVYHALHKPSRLLRWRKPHLGHLRCRHRSCWCHIEPPPPPPEPTPEPPPKRNFLIPYAGAEHLRERST